MSRLTDGPRQRAHSYSRKGHVASAYDLEPCWYAADIYIQRSDHLWVAVNMLAPSSLTVISLAVLLYAIAAKQTTLIWMAKPLASLGFVLAALQAPDTFSTSYSRTIFLGLVLGWIGDVLLIPTSDWTFQLGLVSFLLGHIAYIIAFCQNGLNLTHVLLAIPSLATFAIVIRNAIWPTIPNDLRVPVLFYIVVISTMVATAIGGVTFARHPKSQVRGAFLFYLSDLLVAREKFLVQSFTNPLIGLPLYYAAQLVLAGTLYE